MVKDTSMEDMPIAKLLLKLSPPVMLALLIQSVYNIVDSYFIARYSAAGFTALSVFFPVQLLMIALATGTGVGINILVSRIDGEGKTDTGAQCGIVKSGLFLGIVNYLVFASLGLYAAKPFFEISSAQGAVRALGCEYANIVLLFSFPLFAEANCTKILQARGDMSTPMFAQVAGALFNVAADPVLIFGHFGFPELGMKGAAIATVAGQLIAMSITLAAVLRLYRLSGKISFASCVKIYRAGFPSMVLQALFTVYIIGLNLILKLFTEDAVTVLGIYYKLQTFYLIPIAGLEQVILPIISFNYGARDMKRVGETLADAMSFTCAVMFAATLLFMAAPDALMSAFSPNAAVVSIGRHALRVISVSFVPLGAFLIFVAYFQGIDMGRAAIAATVLRQVALFVPLAWLLHFFGLEYVWYTFPATEFLTAALCTILYLRRGKAARSGKTR